jgi:hypothetical protein
MIWEKMPRIRTGCYRRQTKTKYVRQYIVTSGDIQLRGGIQSDIVIIDGWPETERPPRGATKTWTWRSGESIVVKLIIAELGFTSDMCFSDTVLRKREKYGPLIATLRDAGWSVAPLTHVITVGARATVLSRNVNLLKELGIVKVADQKAMQRRLAYTAAIQLNIIVWQYRKLCRTRRNNIDNICTTGMDQLGAVVIFAMRAETSSDCSVRPGWVS